MRRRDARRETVIGLVTVLTLGLGVLAAFNAEDLPIIGGGTTYSAYFSESAGLVTGNEVRVAGVKVGEVRRVSLARNQVLVDFRVRDTWIGDHSTASIQIKTVLGDKYLALAPEGTAAQDPRQPITKDRTLSPFDVTDAIDQLASTVGAIDPDKLATSFQVVADSLRNAPGPLKQALSGLTGLSRTIASRDQQLTGLLSGTNQLTSTVASRDDQIGKLLADGNLLLGEVRNRKQAISSLLTGTQNLAAQLSGLVADNQEQLKPALNQLDQLTGVLARNQDNLSRALASLAPFVRVFNNTIGTGRWFDGYICGLLPPAQTTAGLEFNPGGCTTPLVGGK
ncbi:MCE family protein [Kutzneria viridogrisea]|uniref:ABC transporter substrate-binding protein n=2 Tax=Kutzneria TaxID=43356 RepID=W5W8D2_9PSEU|nr:MCE family protein [Kutzneria albida]AHH96791.1 ABC transporter substrate-binding protein [Kutzneria albida DSM 43870]MBA8927990.1 phospholipid/cholesterol/gamma-HCH transport system substrate-binding protein [Kutzneria viridogrisea]